MNVMFVANRQVRVVPRGWSHPKNEAGHWVALLPADRFPRTREDIADWIDNHGERPRRSEFMPDPGTGETEIIAYETTSEGTPISPAFPNTPEGKRQLVAWCTDNATTFAELTAGAEAWAAILFGDRGALVQPDGRVVA